MPSTARITPNNPVTPTSICGNDPDNMWLSNGRNDLDHVRPGQRADAHRFPPLELQREPGNPSVYTRRGVQTVGVYIGNSLLANGSDYATQPAVNWGPGQNFTFSQASGLANYSGNDYSFSTPVSGRYIQLYVTGNFGPAITTRAFRRSGSTTSPAACQAARPSRSPAARRGPQRLPTDGGFALFDRQRRACLLGRR